MKIKLFVSMGLVGCRREDEIEVDDDMADKEIEDIARDFMFEEIEWGYERIV